MLITVHIETFLNLALEFGSRAISCARNPQAGFRKTVHSWTDTRRKHRSDRAAIWWKNMAPCPCCRAACVRFERTFTVRMLGSCPDRQARLKCLSLDLHAGLACIFRNCAKWDCMASVSMSRCVHAP
jgi:hypothetical protein